MDQQSGSTKSHYSVSFVPTGEKVEYFRKVVETCHHREQWGRIILFNTHNVLMNDRIILPLLHLGMKVSSFGLSVYLRFILESSGGLLAFVVWLFLLFTSNVACLAFPFLLAFVIELIRTLELYHCFIE